MDILAFPYRFVIQMALFAILAVWAWRRGGGPEKACAWAFVGMFVADRLYHLLVTPAIELETVDGWHFALDIAVLAAIVPIALRANRLYPMGLAACQLIAVNAHIARDSFTQITPIAYSILVVAPSYLQLVILACGIGAHVQRQRRHGPYRDWRHAALTA
ncbi:hypothetical protein U4960_02050 [Altererythrobacter sp. H2]|uniref:hypothetical protein n=1 Tax=Altererythrobacter sp. H2 TaxID=3108391 RepID=UPI000BCD7F2C|nr:hypothetical protein [Altererythrobacter sp. H2]OZA94733.1 MAG: hypothetical protein B7X57_00375 [Erythrobacter sp. 34-65-8]WRK96136.1 hypothetical protein U4960_02050 [Altererythrobacter sp. H2]